MPPRVLRREGRRLDTHCREGHAKAEAETQVIQPPQGCPSSPQKLKEAGRCSLEPLEGGQSCEHLDFSPVKHDSDIKKEYISVL